MFHKRSFTLFFVLTIVSGCGDSETYSLKNISIGNAATGGGIAPVGLLGMSVSKMVDKFHEIASELMFEGENRGDAVLEMAGNRLDVAIQNANIIMSNQLNTLFNNLSVSEQSFFTQPNTVVSGALAPANKIVSILEQANLNLIDLTNRLPLTEKRYNFINQIEGLCQIHDAGNYRIRISGLGFGQDVDNASYVPAVKIGGKTVPQNFLTRIPPYTMEVVIPHDMLESYFKKNQVASVDLEIGMEANTSSSCALLFHCKNTIHSAWKPKLVLRSLSACPRQQPRQASAGPARSSPNRPCSLRSPACHVSCSSDWLRSCSCLWPGHPCAAQACPGHPLPILSATCRWPPAPIFDSASASAALAPLGPDGIAAALH